MELRVLRYFLAVAREESISSAADSLHLTQPTLSRQIIDLEQELGTKLLIRSNRKVTLTDAGMRLRRRAEDIVELVDKTEAEFQGPEDIISGDVHIGGGETHAMGLIANVIHQMQARHPKVRFHLYSGNADDVLERLDKGLLDFGLLIEPANHAKYDSLRLPAIDVWGVLMRRDSPLAGHKVIRPQDLWDAPLMISRQRFVSNEIAGWFQKDFEALHLAATYNLVYNASLLVEEGIGYALCLDKLVNTTGSSTLCFRPLEPRLEAGLMIVWKKHQVFSKASEAFLWNLQSSFDIASSLE